MAPFVDVARLTVSTSMSSNEAELRAQGRSWYRTWTWQAPARAEAALVHNSRRVLAAGILRANASFIVERLPFASAAGTQAALRRTHARDRVFREGDPATVTYDHYRSRVNAPGSWRDITPCH